MKIYDKNNNLLAIIIREKEIPDGRNFITGDEEEMQLASFNYKKETIYVLSGQLRIISGPDQNNLTGKIYTAGDSITISPGTVHRMEGAEDSVYLEASTPEMDDVVRLVDDYDRAE